MFQHPISTSAAVQWRDGADGVPATPREADQIVTLTTDLTPTDSGFTII